MAFLTPDGGYAKLHQEPVHPLIILTVYSYDKILVYLSQRNCFYTNTITQKYLITF
jgi:hypothetical protein